MTSEQHPFPPSVLFRSFLLVGGAYVVNWMCVFGTGFVVAVFLFPDAFAIMNSEPAEFQRVMAESPEKIFPPEMLWTILVINAATCFGLGFLTTRWAPLRPFHMRSCWRPFCLHSTCNLPSAPIPRSERC